MLLILAGVALATLTGQGNIIGNAENAVGKYNNSVADEQQLLNEIEKYFQNYLEGEDKEEGTEPLVIPSEWNETVQTPEIMEGMTPVYWSTDGGITASTTQEGATEIYARVDENGKASSSGTDNPNFKWENWYAYIAGDNSTDTKTSRWANVVTDDGSYWVWIPRYKYKITNQPTEIGIDSAGKIDIQFIPTTDKMGAEGYTTGANADGEILTTDSEGYIIHPAFENGSSTGKNNGFENGEWDSELPGFWIAKYEMSMEDGEGNELNTDEVGGNVALSADIKMVSKPNVTSWRYIQIGQAYQNCINYDTAKNSHMIKNSEWGAVAYLTHSQYGRNGNEITINNDSSFITGIAGESVTTSEATSTENRYNTTKGMLASTTGNIYGIYDMNGCANEYTSVWNKIADNYFVSDNYVTDYGKAIDGTRFFSSGENSDKMRTAYIYELHGTENIIYRTGDAMKEVYLVNIKAWFNDIARSIDDHGPFLVRGGNNQEAEGAGIFYSLGNSGQMSYNVSLRIVLV